MDFISFFVHNGDVVSSASVIGSFRPDPLRNERAVENGFIMRWRQRLGEEQLVALIQESLSVAHKTGRHRSQGPGASGGRYHGAAKGRCASDRRAADASGHPPSSSGSPSAIVCRCARAICAWPRAPPSWWAAIPTLISSSAPGPQLKFLRTRLGRIIRDIRRKIDGDAALEARFGPLLDLAQRVRSQDQHQRGPKVYALHAPEVECIGKGKARAPYEFGCKVQYRHPRDVPEGRTVRAPCQGACRSCDMQVAIEDQPGS